MANVFNPDPFKGTDSPSFLGASRGRASADARTFAVDQSAGIKASNLANTVNNAATLGLSIFDVVDKGFQESQRKQFQAAHDDILNEFGVNDATNLEQGAGNTDPKLPGQITDSQKELANLARAQRAGAMNSSTYWARTQSVVRQLRAKYPAYRDQIDNMVSSITGATPANALRSALMAENTRLQSQAENPEKDRQRLINANLQYLPADYAAREGKDGQYSTLELQDYISKQRRGILDIEVKAKQAGLESSNLGLIDKRRNVNQNQAEDVFNQDSAMTMRSNMVSIFGSGSKYNTLINQARELSASGKPVPAEQAVQIQSLLAQGRQQYVAVMAAKHADYISKGMDPKVADANRERYLKQYDDIAGYATSGKYELLNHNILRLEAESGESAINISNLSPTLRDLSGLKRVVGPEVEKYLFTSLDGQTLVGNIMTELTLGQGKAIRNANQEAKGRGAVTPETRKGVVDFNIKALTSPTTSLEGMQNAANALYGEENKGWLSDISPGNQYRTFQMMTTPAMTDRMYKLRESDPEVWAKYRGWTLDAFSGLMRTAINTTRETVVHRKNINIGFDEKNGQFTYAPKQATPARGITSNPLNFIAGGAILGAGEAIENVLLDPLALHAVSELNKALVTLKPVFDKEPGGQGIGSFLSDVVKANGIDVEADFQGSTADNLWSSLVNPVGGTLKGRSNLGGENKEKEKFMTIQTFFSMQLENRSKAIDDETQIAIQRFQTNPQNLSDHEVSKLAELYADVNTTASKGIEQERKELSAIMRNAKSDAEFEAALNELIDLTNDVPISDEQSRGRMIERGTELIRVALTGRKLDEVVPLRASLN